MMLPGTATIDIAERRFKRCLVRSLTQSPPPPPLAPSSLLRVCRAPSRGGYRLRGGYRDIILGRLRGDVGISE